MAEGGGFQVTSPSRRLSTQDASFLYIESASAFWHVGSLGIFDGEIPFEQAFRFMEQRIHLVPRFRQRLIFAPFNINHAMLVDDPEFRLENHFKLHLLKGTSEAEMIREALDLFEPRLDRNKPLWECYMLEGMKGRAALLSKIHHSMIDGVAGVELMRLTSDFTPDAPPPPPPERPWNPPPLPSQTQALVEATTDYLSAQLESARDAMDQLMRDPAEVAARTREISAGMLSLTREFARPAVPAPWNAALISSQRNLAWSRYPFSDFRAIRSAVGCTINDVVLVILSEAAARYLKQHGYHAAGEEFRIFCPVNVRRPEELTDLGNRVSAMFPMVPAEPMDLLERCAKVAAETARIKEARLPQIMDRMGSMGNLVPPALMGWMERLSRVSFDASSALVRRSGFTPQPGGPALFPMASFLATNVPGFQVPTYFCGKQLLDPIGFAPLSGNIGYGVAITSYNQNMYLFLTGESNLLPDIDLMKRLCDEVFEELKNRASAAARASERAN